MLQNDLIYLENGPILEVVIPKIELKWNWKKSILKTSRARDV